MKNQDSSEDKTAGVCVCVYTFMYTMKNQDSSEGKTAGVCICLCIQYHKVSRQF